MASKVEGKVIFVTGASSGIGEAIAELLASSGAKVVLAARRIAKLDALKAKITEAGGKAHVVELDVRNFDQFKAAVAEAEKEFGPIDCLINNAGIMPLSLFKNTQVQQWNDMIDINIKGVLNGIATVLSGMTERNAGDIINISSDAGRKLFPGGGVYCGTKWAVEAITQGLRQETSGTNIRILSIQPGATYSELGSHITDPDILNSPMSLSRFLDAADVANAVLYALSQPPHCSINEILLRPTEQRS